MEDQQVSEITNEAPIEQSYENDRDNGDAIAALLNQEPEVVEVIPEPVIPEIPEKFKVKVQGEEKEVSLEELKNGYQRQSDYTAKTQELSQQRQDVDAKRSEYEQYLSSIPMLSSTAESNIRQAQEYLYSKDFINLAATDPAEYISQKAQLEASVVQNQQFMQNAQQQWNQHQQEINSSYAQSFQADLAKSNEILVKELGDGWASGELQKTLLDYGIKNGFDAQALNQVNDFKVVQMLNKARLYDEMIANKGVNQKRVNAIPPKVISPNSNAVAANTSFQDRKKAALRSGNSDDIGKLISELMG